MGIFNFFRPKAKNSVHNDGKLHSSAREEKRNRFMDENVHWQKNFNILLNFRVVASSLEKEGKLFEAIKEYSKSVNHGESCKSLSFNNYANDIERIIILYNKTKQKEKLVKFLKEIILKYSECREAEKWTLRLSSLTRKKVNFNGLTKADIYQPIPDNPSLGKKLELLKDSFPKFNFYFDMPKGMDTSEYLFKKKPVPFELTKELRKLKDEIKAIINEARKAENENNFKAAIELYEKLIVEECLEPQPYERLMRIYKKIGWLEEENRVVISAINFFSKKKDIQKNKILSIANEFNMKEMAYEYINSNKKIFYYGGAFELYNPYPIIKKWNERILKNPK